MTVQNNTIASNSNLSNHWLWHLQNDPKVPVKTRLFWKPYGHPKDEFADNGHRPHEIYVREARRLDGRLMLTEHDSLPAPDADSPARHADAIAFTDWFMDSHAVTEEKQRGSLHEGKLMLHAETWPGQIPWRSLLPRDLDNLVVPVCLSSTHVAWGAIRLEPLWMQTGEAAGWATALALRSDKEPGTLKPKSLVSILRANGFVTDFYDPAQRKKFPPLE